MRGGVVEDDDGGLDQAVAEVIKKEHDVRRYQALRGGEGVKIRAVVAQEAGHVDAWPAGGFQSNGLAGGLPGAGHVGNEEKAALVVVVEVEVVGLGQASQVGQVCLGLVKGLGVAFEL